MLYQPNFSADFRTIMPDGNEWDLPVMQYTGLKDRDGKEVYEGDIVGVCFKEKEIGEGVAYQFTVDIPDVYARGAKEDWEIIGNIYENPDIIKA